MQVMPTKIEIREKDEDPHPIEIMSTIPPACSEQDTNDCHIHIRVVTPERLVTSQSRNQSLADQCLYRISGESWDETRGMAHDRNNPLEIRVARDPYIHQYESHVIQLELVRDGHEDMAPSLWDGYQLDEVTVRSHGNTHIILHSICYLNYQFKVIIELAANSFF